MVIKSKAVLVLKAVHQDSTLYLLRKGTTLHFHLDHSLYGQQLEIFCNYPIESRHLTRNEKKHFNRNEYQKVPLNGSGVYLQEAGSYRFYFTNKRDDAHLGSGYFIVEPELHFGVDDIDDPPSLSLDSIQCQTVLSKLLGNFATWYNKLCVSYKSGYNMIHFTPIQELGGSNSCYSLKNQLALNPAFGEDVTFEQLHDLLKKLRVEWGVLSIGDVVLNHTANESPWLLEHPDASYNCMNCPYLRPAYLLDAALARFSMRLAKGIYNIAPSTMDWTEEHLETIKHLLFTEELPMLRLEEMFMCDVAKCIGEFRERARYTVPQHNKSDILTGTEMLELLQDEKFRRFQSNVDMDLALRIYNVYRKDCWDEESRLSACVASFKHRLDNLNDIAANKVHECTQTAIDNCIAHIRYQRVDKTGPKLGTITAQQPLVDRYFTPPRMQTGQNGELDDATPWETIERAAYEPLTAFTVMAHNGWVLSDSVEVNFALYPASVYFRRSLIPWCDSVKLNYGSQPEDSPFLWQHMRMYMKQMALLFDGLRLDNCHSTPLHVAEAMVDAAREINDDLYLLAELFTNNSSTDNVFVNRLGITSLVRESMSACDSRELSRVLHRYGGDPIGSLLPLRADVEPNILEPSLARALLLDQSHDNESVVSKRNVRDAVTNCALVCMAGCAVGSTRGYDELVPHKINVVTEDRQYAEWSGDNDSDDTTAARILVNNSTGIIAARRELNNLHSHLSLNNFTEIYVDQVDDDIVAITRHNPDTQQGVLLVAFTVFDGNALNKVRNISLSPDGLVKRVRLECQWGPNGDSKSFNKDPHILNGLNMNVSLKTDINVGESEMVSVEQEQLHLYLTAGSVVVIDLEPIPATTDALNIIRTAIPASNNADGKKDCKFLELDKLSLLDLNVLLYRCEEEQRDSTGGAVGAYDIPGYGKLVYCGLQGFMSVLSSIGQQNDVDHPLCENLRNGPWMTEYVWRHLLFYTATFPRLIPVAEWLRRVMGAIATLPSYLRASQFDFVLNYLYNEVVQQACRHQRSLFEPKIRDSLRDSLWNVSAQMSGIVPSAPLLKITGSSSTTQGSLCAGLPHFTTGYCRNWGRDTFISLRGLYILTGHHDEARAHILAYAACLRHGLIPNLLDGGTKPRFNCRDAIWWWLYCIRCYVLEIEDGDSILATPVRRLFTPNEDKYQPLYDIIQEALSIHFQGFVFREKDAGPAIDAHMSNAGFTVQIGVHPNTGFVFGGNMHNCGTWMDKMGHTGRPATPRDGSAIELIGLQYAVLTWLADEVNKEGKRIYPHMGVSRRLIECEEGSQINNVQWTWAGWAKKIQDNFERCFWIGEDCRDDLVNRRNIYKDTYGSSLSWPDFQLRCNFPVAMVVAPDLFTPSRASAALLTMQQHLLSTDENGNHSLGIRTLDPSDWNYRPDYDNTNEGSDEAVVRGFNYHNGPEWVWPLGYFLRAKLLFPDSDPILVRDSVLRHLAAHNVHVHNNVWRGLPELTNGGGRYCRDSCRTQAWSAATMLEVLYDMEVQELSQKQEDREKWIHSKVTY